MKGVILAGGKGSRLYPMTQVTNKHLVPVGNLPMIEYPLYTLRQLGIDGSSIVTGGEHFSSISQYLMAVHPDLVFSYYPQPQAGGIAQALSLVEPSVRGENMAVILGDNIFDGNFSDAAKKFEESDLGAMLFLKRIKNPERFGVAELNNDLIVGIEEKPKTPKSDLAVTGLYFYDESVFDKIRTLYPSARGEYEITDVNNLYIKEGRLGYHIIEGFWGDAGTIKSRTASEDFVRNGLERKILLSLASNQEVLKRLKESFEDNL